MKHLTLACASAVAFAAAAFSQGPDDAVSQRPSPAPATLLPAPSGPVTALDAIELDDLFTVPIHTAEADNGFAYGTWASGPNYKVSFNGQMAFYPILGERYPHNLPIGWRTTGVQVGAQNLLVEGEAAVETHGEWHYEYRFDNLTERYDLRPEGVEQSFVIHRRPLGQGDLVIRGALDTELHAEPRASMVGAIVFRDGNGTPIIEYGAALAIDAEGRKQPMETAFEGSQVTLRLDAAWLKTASFPLTVDPLLRPLAISIGREPARTPSIGRDDVANQLLTSYGRAVSASDTDLYAVITDDGISVRYRVFTDITASWGTSFSDVAFVGGPRRWIIVFQRNFSGTTGSWLRYHTRASGDRNLRTTYSPLAGSGGNRVTVPDVGGTDSYSIGNNALVVYQSDTGLLGSANSSVLGRLVNVATNSVGPIINLRTSPYLDCESPAVNQVSSGFSESWICCWAELNHSIANDDWDITLKRVRSTGTIHGSSFLGGVSGADHLTQPKIAGRDGRYMAVFGVSENAPGIQLNGSGTSIQVQRFDWDEGSTSPRKYDMREVFRGSQAWCGDIAYDDKTESHWAVTYHSMVRTTRSTHLRAEFARIGYDSEVCDKSSLNLSDVWSFSPSVTFDNDHNRFAIAVATITSVRALYGVLYRYPSFPQPTLFGTGCGPITIGTNSNAHSRKAHAGAEFFEVRVQNVPPNALGAMHIGHPRPSPVPIPGLPGCFMNVDTIFLPRPVNAIGTTVRMPCPISSTNHAGWIFQYICFDPAFSNPMPLYTSRGLQIFSE